jgi:CBS domain-containing protein
VTNEANAEPGGPDKRLALDVSGSTKPAVINCPACGAENIQGTDYCVNCNSDLRTLDIPPDSWSPAVGPPGESVAEIGSRNPVSVGPDASVRDAITAMRDADVGCALVVQGGTVLGIFSERDVLIKVTPRRGELLDRSVREVMTANPITVDPEESVLVAINEMAVNGFRHLPIVDGQDQVTGIISARDILGYIAGLVDQG